MEYRKFNDTIILRLNRGEEIVESIKKVVEEEKIDLGYIIGLGAVNEAEIGLFDIKEKKYYPNVYKQDFEISSLHGNISTKEDKPYLHLHIVISDKEQKCYGGHLNWAKISATGEIVIKILKGKVERELDENIGINLYKFL